MNRIAFIDAQNLYLGTTKCWKCAESLNIDLKKIAFDQCACGEAWKVDLKRLRVYLKDKYKIDEAYYVLGHINTDNQWLYTNIQRAGFIILFKQHHDSMISIKKGNVDTDIVFEVMKTIVENEGDKFLLISGDGDYKKLVDYLIKKERFIKILFPNKKYASSLYKKLGSEQFEYLTSIKQKIKYK